jgi:uncharacterized protein
MTEELQKTYYRLLTAIEINTFRYLYHSFQPTGRLTGLIGPRGVGKTTLLLQFIKNKVPTPRDAFYFSADHIFFNTTTLWEFVQTLYEEEGVDLIFIDEIHKYPNWNQELKNIYDSFPKLKIVFSGSSSLDLVGGSYDLSRRASLHYLQGLSFREYLNFTTGSKFEPLVFADIIARPQEASAALAEIPRLKGHFKTYLRQGYYPFLFEDEGQFFDRLERVINKTIYEDIANYYSLKTTNLRYFTKILSFLATIPPGKISMNNLARNLNIDSKTVLHYVHILNDTGLARILYPNQRGTKLLRAPEKVFLENTTLLHALCTAMGQEVNIGTQRELAFVSGLTAAGEKVYCSKKRGDFIVNETVFEIGGRNKSNKQIRGSDKPTFLVKDDILIGGRNTIPLYLFGFLY